MSKIKVNCQTIREARKAGELYYYTGKPCKHGHIDVRSASSGLCLTCRREHARNRYQQKLSKQKNKPGRKCNEYLIEPNEE